MAFTSEETARHLQELEKYFWSKRRPPLDIRDQIREGQRLEGQSVELFFMRPAWNDPTNWLEESIAKTTYVRSSGMWKIYWKRADGRWHPYPQRKQVATLRAFLRLVHEDRYCCFFG